MAEPGDARAAELWSTASMQLDAVTADSPPAPPPATAAERGSRLKAGVYDLFLLTAERAGMRERRRTLLRGARGRVLEIGAGTGLNAPHYPETVDELVLTEPNLAMSRRLRGRVRRAGLGADVVCTSAERLPARDGSVDTVVSTFVLCTVEEPARVLAEIARVLRPGGQFLFMEHVRADTDRLARWQDLLEAPWRRFADGCRCNRPLLEEIRRSGFAVDEPSRAEWRAMPPIVRPVVIGRAPAPA